MCLRVRVWSHASQGTVWVFLYKSSSRTKHYYWIFLLMLLSWMFISFYTSIYFFVKKFIFLNVSISVNTIFECLCMFFGRERGHQLSTFAMQWYPKCIPLHTGGGGVAPLVYVGTFTLSLFMFSEVFLSYSVLFDL